MEGESEIILFPDLDMADNQAFFRPLYLKF